MAPPRTVGLPLVAVWLLVFAPAQASSQDKGASEETVEVVEEVEIVEEVEVVDVVEANNGETNDGPHLTLVRIIGRNHAAAVHIPIGLILGVLLLELMTLLFPKVPLGKSPLVISIAAVASFLPAALTGFLRANEMFTGNEPPELLFEHRNLMIAASILFTLSLVQRLIRKDDIKGAWRWIQLGLIILSALLVAAGGHHGGQLVYGENFLPY